MQEVFGWQAENLFIMKTVKPAAPLEIRLEFRRRWIRHMVCAAMVLLLFAAGSKFGEARILAGGVALGVDWLIRWVVIGIVGFDFINWRCPKCRKLIAYGDPYPSHCRGCGVRFRDL